ncbi:MAG: carboxypeptidase-like regulatory domain-containing protein [Salinivirgaceae bacterium]|jgi:hypothetical protein|nr:carboxypeptidase-like regulatory domain-containing protein [Salinivirgaceae bacterium]
MKKGTLIILLCLLMLSNFLNAQQLTVTGTVTDGTNQFPLPGVTIFEQGTTNGTITNAEGMYTINASSKDAILLFSFIGFLTEEVMIEGRAEISLSLIPDIQSLSEVVVIGYGTVKKQDATG